MSSNLTAVIEPFVRRGLFPNAELAVTEIARDYILHQIDHYRSIEAALEARYGMSYEHFEDYLHARSDTLQRSSSPTLNQAVMAEEGDALEWKIAHDMIKSWLGLQREIVE